ncbi:MAG: class I SAM-dependent methyltransferase [Verrucomicrobiota bacterium]|nr:class I SAM-dependent methyltransferase [Verrucomicrobiota bacterium]
MISASVTREAVASHYDDLDYFYRDVWGDHVHHGLWLRGDETREEAVLQLVDLVAREMHFASGMRICDIGCGYGAAACVFAARGAEVTGITISPAQFAVAKEGEFENPKFILGDWLANDLPNESFDAAYAIESSEHMPDLRKFFVQAHRVLRGGGRLVVCAWLSADNPSSTQQRLLLEPICREGRMPIMGTADDYRSLGETTGFSLQRFEDITRDVARTWPAIVRRLSGKLFSNPTYVKFLFNRHAHNRVFALTIFRIWIAYRVGAMRYGICTFVKT